MRNLNIRMKQALASLAVANFLVACNAGGSSSGSSPSGLATQPDSYSTAKAFADGSGIARSYKTETGGQLAATYYVANVSGSDINSTAIANFTNKTFLFNGTKGKYYSTTAIINGASRTVRLFEADNGETALVIGQNCTGACIAAIGDVPTSLPSGTYTYTGEVFGTSVGVTDVIDNGAETRQISTAPITLIANFTTNIVTMSGSSADGKMVFNNANLTIDPSNGQLSGTGSVSSPLSAGGSGNAWATEVYGSFHGAGASSVSGVVASTQQTETGPDNFVSTLQAAFSASR